MKKHLILWLTVLMLWSCNAQAGAQPGDPNHTEADISGTYDITITTEQGQEQGVPITIEVMENDRFILGAKLEGYSFTVGGDLTQGEDEQNGKFTFNKSGLVKGDGEFTIRQVEDRYQLEGIINASYSYLGKSGQINGTMEGFRRELISTPTPVPVPDESPAPAWPFNNIMVILAGLIILTALLVYAVRPKR